MITKPYGTTSLTGGGGNWLSGGGGKKFIGGERVRRQKSDPNTIERNDAHPKLTTSKVPIRSADRVIRLD